MNEPEIHSLLAEAVEAGLGYAQECLATHDATLGRTTPQNKGRAETIERDIQRLKRALGADAMSTPLWIPISSPPPFHHEVLLWGVLDGDDEASCHKGSRKQCAYFGEWFESVTSPDGVHHDDISASLWMPLPKVNELALPERGSKHEGQ